MRRPKLKQQSSKNLLSLFLDFSLLLFFGFQVLSLSLPLFSIFCKFSKVVWIASILFWKTRRVGSYFHKKRKRFHKKRKKVSFFFWWNRKTHCYWFRYVPAGKFRTHFTGTKHPLVPPRVEFQLIPGRSGHSDWFRWVSAGITIPAVLKSNPINPSCHSTGHLKKRISSQQSSFSSSSVFLCVSSSATFFLILVVAIFCLVQLFIVLSFVFCNITFSCVSLHVTRLTIIWKGSYDSAFAKM